MSMLQTVTRNILQNLRMEPIDSDVEYMIETMEDLYYNPFITATNSWNERQIIVSHILDARLPKEVRDSLIQRAEAVLSAVQVVSNEELIVDPSKPAYIIKVK